MERIDAKSINNTIRIDTVQVKDTSGVDMPKVCKLALVYCYTVEVGYGSVLVPHFSMKRGPLSSDGCLRVSITSTLPNTG